MPPTCRMVEGGRRVAVWVTRREMMWSGTGSGWTGVVDSGSWTVDRGSWIMDDGQWIVEGGR